MEDGSVGFVTDIYNLPEGDKNKREKQLEAHLSSEVHYEREWRNCELTLTDKLLLVDATYNSSPIRGSLTESDVLDYRKKLREYDLKYMPRPTRPEWFNG